MAAAYPKEHIPQNLYEKMMKEKAEKDKMIIANRARAKKMAEETRLARENAVKEIKPEVKVLSEDQKFYDEDYFWEMKYDEQVKLISKMTDLSISKVRKTFRYEKDRVEELMRLHKNT